MDHSIIIQLLKEKEANLLAELHNVRALLAGVSTQGGIPLLFNNRLHNRLIALIPATYEECRTYNSKILFILGKRGSPMTVNEVVDEVGNFQPELPAEKLHKTISYSLSILAREGYIKKYPFNRHIKYALEL